MKGNEIYQFPHNTRPYPDLQSALDAVSMKHFVNGEPVSVFYLDHKKRVKSFLVVGNEFPGIDNRPLILGLDKTDFDINVVKNFDGGIVDLNAIYKDECNDCNCGYDCGDTRFEHDRPCKPNHPSHCGNHHYKKSDRMPDFSPYRDIENDISRRADNQVLYDENLVKRNPGIEDVISEYDYDEMDLVQH